MVEGQLQISEEYFGNEPTGVEAEPREDDERASPQRPWNPSDIRVAARNFSLRNIVDMVDNKDLELVPDFQRNEVWGPVQRSRLIESILLQIPLPAFYFVEDNELAFQVVDGLQRLSTVYQFIRGPRPFALSGLEYLDTLNGMRFDDLEPSMRRRIFNSQIMVNVIDPATPDEVKYNIYKRINTGGSPLNLQEIRHCMSKERSREFLKSLAKLDEFQDAVDGTKLAVRMADRELVLRFCAFQFFPPEKYRDHGSIDLLLDRMTKALDDPARTSDAFLEQTRDRFQRGLANCDIVFGKHVFRKWPLESAKVNPFNRTLFETWSYALAEYETDDVRRRRVKIAEQARELMTYDQPYIQSITAATGDPVKLEYRFKAAIRVAREAK